MPEDKITRDSEVRNVTIANAAQASEVIDIRHYAILGMMVPDALTGTTLSFQVSDAEGGVYKDLYDTANIQVSMTVAQGRAYDLPTELASWPYFKIKAGSVQTAIRTFKVLLKG